MSIIWGVSIRGKGLNYICDICAKNWLQGELTESRAKTRLAATAVCSRSDALVIWSQYFWLVSCRVTRSLQSVSDCSPLNIYISKLHHLPPAVSGHGSLMWMSRTEYRIGEHGESSNTFHFMNSVRLRKPRTGSHGKRIHFRRFPVFWKGLGGVMQLLIYADLCWMSISPLKSIKIHWGGVIECVKTWQTIWCWHVLTVDYWCGLI